jgi:protein tyrosine phosphatase
VSSQAIDNLNKYKNRDENMVCFDENRVKLSKLSGDSFINATKISVFIFFFF